MTRSRYLLLMSSAPILLSACADGPNPPYDDCASANPSGSYMTMREQCKPKAQAEQARLAAAMGATLDPKLAAVQTVHEARAGVASLNFTAVPTWSDADIAAQFAALRDKRYITDAFDTTPNPRRITWMFPDDGCFDRAEQFCTQAAANGKTRPAKLFAFAEAPLLHVTTDNTSSGTQDWQFHVVPLVKNSAGQPIVFDPALNPCRPMAYKEWLSLMVTDLSVFDNYAGGNGVTVASTWAYNGDSPITGETPHSRETWSYNSETYLVVEEWLRQYQLGRDPVAVLGTSPPWSGSACIKTFPVDQFTILSSTGSRTLTVTCPYATLNVGGGFNIDPGVRISKNARNGNGWDVSGTNTGVGFGSFGAQAICLQGAPSSASVSSIQGNVVNVANNASSSSTATCGAGQLVGGGYTTTVSGTPASSMRIYSNQRATTNANQWQVSAKNLTGASKSVTSFAYCLQNSGFTFSQASASVDASGNAVPVCAAPKVGMAGGWSFPSTTADIAYNATTASGTFTVSLSPAPGGSGDPGSKGYEECLTHP